MPGTSDPAGDNLVLVGFMGAGKSTIARILAERTGYRLVDLDHLVETRSGRAISEIFADLGEQAFRDRETEALRSLAGIRESVIATGGGVVERPENWTLMRSLGMVVFLDAEWQVLQKRIDGTTHRPLAAPGEGWEPVKRRWLSRLPLYRQADVTVDSGQLTPGVAAEEILSRSGMGRVGRWKN